MNSLAQDLRYAVRALIRRPGFAALAVLTLAIGIGVNTVAFSAINALLLRPFTTAGADRAGWILLERPGNPHGSASLADFELLARATTGFSGIAAEGRLPVSLRTPAGAEQAWTMAVSANYLEIVGARAEMGRLFTKQDVEGSEIPVVVSHRFWTDKLEGSASVAGRTIGTQRPQLRHRRGAAGRLSRAGRTLCSGRLAASGASRCAEYFPLTPLGGLADTVWPPAGRSDPCAGQRRVEVRGPVASRRSQDGQAADDPLLPDERWSPGHSRNLAAGVGRDVDRRTDPADRLLQRRRPSDGASAPNVSARLASGRPSARAAPVSCANS